MLGHKVMGAGINALAVQAICMDAKVAISAAGTNQATATALTNAVNFLSTVAAGTGVVLSSSATLGDSQYVYNGGSNPVKVYPHSGAKINGLAANAPMILAVKTGCMFFCGSATQWGGLLSA